MLHLMNIILYIAEYLLNGALITTTLHSTLSSSGIQEQISQTGKYSLVNLVCAQLIMHWNRLMPCSSAVTQIIVAIHCLHYLILLCRPSLSTYLEKLCMDVRFFTTSIHLIDYPSLMPIALLQIIMSYKYNYYCQYPHDMYCSIPSLLTLPLSIVPV